MDGRHVRSNEDSGHHAALKWLFTAIPDVQYTIVHMLSQGDLVAFYTTFSGTAQGELFGLPAARKKLKGEQMFLYRLRGGKIAEQWEVVEAEKIKGQLEKGGKN